MNQQWINHPAFPAIVGSAYEVSFGQVEHQGKFGDWTARIRIDGINRNQWIDLDTNLPLDPELVKFVIQAYRPL